MNNERGNVAVLVVVAVVLAGLLCLAIARLGGATVDKARANTAADAAALAAAGALGRGGTPAEAVRVARSIAIANGAVLTRCRCSGTEATVEVRVNSARSRARARVAASPAVARSARKPLAAPLCVVKCGTDHARIGLEPQGVALARRTPPGRQVWRPRRSTQG